MSIAITGISSMATRAVLAELAQALERHFGIALEVQSVGGVDAARRVAEGEAFDLVFLAADAIDRLIAEGHLEAGSRVDLARSAMAAAVPAGAKRPRIDSEDALKRAVLAAPRVAYSTGPSGRHLLSLFERWGIAAQMKERALQAPPGIPVARLLAAGEASLGFQQAAELAGAPGVALLGPLPGAAAHVTTFSAGLGRGRPSAAAARAALAFMNTPEGDAIKRRHGMEAAQ